MGDAVISVNGNGIDNDIFSSSIVEKDWYWIISLFLFFLEREAIMEICFLLMSLFL